MQVHLAMPTELRAAYEREGFEHADPDTATVIATGAVAADWPGTLDQLTLVYRAARTAATSGQPVVFVVPVDDLLGRSGPTAAMAAGGIVSAARTMAAEMRRAGVPVNTLATGGETTTATVVAWARVLLVPDGTGPTGELIHLGGSQIGKALS